MKSLEDQALIALNRASNLAGRPGITIPSRDIAFVDRVTGSRARSYQALRRLAGAGKAIPVRRDVSVLPGPTGLVEVGLIELVDAIAPRPYLITGGRALELHELTDQHFFKIAVLVPKPVSPVSWRGESVDFFPVSESRIWGSERNRRTSNKGVVPAIATRERAVLDSVSHPRYGVSLAQAVGALRAAIGADPAFTARLARATERFRVAAVARRIGLLVERLAGTKQAAPFERMIGNSPTPIPLRAGGEAEGPIDRHWRVQINADLDLVFETAEAP